MSADAGAIWIAYNDAGNAADFEAMARFVSPELAVVANGEAAFGSAEDDLRAMNHLLGVFPDYRREVEEVITTDDRATIRWRMRGTPLRSGVPALDLAGCSVIRVSGGRITEAYLYYQGSALDEVLRAAHERP
jgi:hypothetical protein